MLFVFRFPIFFFFFAVFYKKFHRNKSQQFKTLLLTFTKNQIYKIIILLKKKNNKNCNKIPKIAIAFHHVCELKIYVIYFALQPSEINNNRIVSNTADEELSRFEHYQLFYQIFVYFWHDYFQYESFISISSSVFCHLSHLLFIP